MDTQAAMRVALRVLTAICERRNPDSKDVEVLKKHAPAYSNLSPEELACKVINVYVEEQKDGRAKELRNSAALKR